MNEIADCLPEHVRPYYIGLQAGRIEAAAESYSERLTELRRTAAAEGWFNSGRRFKNEADLLRDHVDGLAIGTVGDLLGTCQLYDVPLTIELCECFIAGMEGLVRVRNQQATDKLLQDINTAGFAKHFNNWGSEILQRGGLKVMLEIRSKIEAARVTDERGRSKAMQEKNNSGITYNQHIYLHGDGTINASMTGDVIAQWAPSDAEAMRSVQAALSELRANLRSLPPSVEADEALGHVAGAEKAASQGDETRMLTGLKRVSWKPLTELGARVIPEVLLHYLKAHNLA